MDRNVKCDCGKVLFGEVENSGVYILKGVAVVQFASDKANIKCRNCKRWVEGVDQSIFRIKEE